MKAINNKLKKLIADKKLSAYKIAKMSGIDYKGMHTFINNDGNLHYDNMIKLMRALGYRVAMVKTGTPAAARIDAAKIKPDEIIDIGKLTPKVKT